MKSAGIKFLVTDLGLYPEHANALADGGKNQVLYHTEWARSFPSYQEYAIGKDFEYLKKALYFWDYVDEADCIVNFDVHNNDEIAWLRKHLPDKPIFGSGLGERLENDRWLLKQKIKEIGLPLQESVKITGITKLKEYLKKNDNRYVKMNIFRADMESFHVKNYEDLEKDMLMNKIEQSLGPHAEEYEFVVEEEIDTDVEIGFDGFFNGTDYVAPYILGYEYHKGLYIAHVTDELPEPLAETMDKLAPILESINYRGALSTEEKILSPKEHYFLDLCARLPAPCGAIYLLIKNWADLVYKVAAGEYVEIDLPYKYVGALPLETDQAKDRFVHMEVDKKWRENIKFRTVCGRNGDYFAVKGMSSVAVLVAGGNTIDEVLNKIKEAADHIDCHGLDKDSINGMEVVKEIVEKGKRVGIPFE